MILHFQNGIVICIPRPPHPPKFWELKKGVPEGVSVFAMWQKILYSVSHKVWASLDLHVKFQSLYCIDFIVDTYFTLVPMATL